MKETKAKAQPYPGANQMSLKLEFDQLKEAMRINDGLTLRWLPGAGRKDLSGEVKGCTVFIYDSVYLTALTTLRHELIDYVVSKAVEPYKEVANGLLALLNEKAYRGKEDVVERLCGLWSRPRATASGQMTWD